VFGPPAKLKTDLKAAFDGPFILAGGLNKVSAQQALSEGRADLVAMGKAFLVVVKSFRTRRSAECNAARVSLVDGQ